MQIYNAEDIIIGVLMMTRNAGLDVTAAFNRVGCVRVCQCCVVAFDACVCVCVVLMCAVCGVCMQDPACKNDGAMTLCLDLTDIPNELGICSPTCTLATLSSLAR